MSIPFVFGPCGCCKAALAGADGDYQEVIASVPFGIGWVAVLPEPTGLGNFAVQNPFGNAGGLNGRWQVPETTFLTQTIKWTIFETGVSLGEQVLSYTKAGKFTSSPPVDISSVPDGQHAVPNSTLSNPYTLAQATANAVGLLGNVQLLDPGAVYSAFAVNGTILQENLCYASEAAAYPHPNQTLTLVWDIDGNVVILDQTNPTAAPTGNYASWTVMDGMYTVNSTNDGTQSSIWAKKVAFRTRGPVLSLQNYNFTPGGVLGAPHAGATPIASEETSNQPINLPPGEYIFGPGDAAPFGQSSWSNEPASALPSP